MDLWKILAFLPALIEALARLVRALADARRRWSKRPPPLDSKDGENNGS